jgi:preprotein translocase subunit SecG
MSNIQTALLIVHTLIALAIIALVLLQRGKGAEAGAAFGAGASGTVFGARGSTNFFSRTTAVLATLFFASSLALAYISSQRPHEGPRSLIETAAPVEEAPPATDGTVPDLPALDSTDSTNSTDTGSASGDMPVLEDKQVKDPAKDPAQ